MCAPAVSLAAVVALALVAACTETPSFFPPCVDPEHPCPGDDAGVDAGTSDAAAPDASGTMTADAVAEDG